VALVVALVALARPVIPSGVLRVGAAVVLLGLGAYKLLRGGRHPRWVGMRVGFRDLTLWSFLMSSAHGAGLMLLPLLLRGAPPAVAGDGSAHAGHLATGAGATAGFTALGVHTLALFVVMAGTAVAVFEVLGLELLRRAWVNVDALWAAALLAAGIVTLLL
jgi:hypothetical protein